MGAKLELERREDAQVQRQSTAAAPAPAPAPASVAGVLALQRSAGNAATVQALAGGPTLAAKGFWRRAKGVLFGEPGEDDLGRCQGVGPGGVPTNTCLPSAGGGDQWARGQHWSERTCPSAASNNQQPREEGPNQSVVPEEPNQSVAPEERNQSVAPAEAEAGG